MSLKPKPRKVRPSALSRGNRIPGDRVRKADGTFEDLLPGTEVRSVIAEGEGAEGPQASTVKPIGEHHPVG